MFKQEKILNIFLNYYLFNSTCRKYILNFEVFNLYKHILYKFSNTFLNKNLLITKYLLIKHFSKQLNIIKMYLQRLCINTNQMLSITKVFQSKDIRSDFFIYSKDYITDLENYKKVKIK